MEKAAVRTTGKYCIGLLVFLCLFSIQSWSLSGADIKKLRVKPDEKFFFTAQENGYTLTIPDIEPSRVQTDLPSLPLGVQFISSKRDEYMDITGARGTTIQLWFSFTDTGPVKLPPLIVLINGHTYYIPFEDVTVYENPAVITPELYVMFDDSVNVITKGGRNIINTQTGQSIRFTIYIKYCVQITNFSWQIPHNSIFKEVKRYDITNEIPRGAGFSTEAFPISTFEWKPLVSGSYSLPQVNISATAYNGSRRQVFLPDYEINVEKAEVVSESESTENIIYKDAFTEIHEEKEIERTYVLTPEDCKTLAELRSRERNSVFYVSAKKQRLAIEDKLEVKARQNEPSLPFVYLLMSIVVLFLLFTMCSLLLKHYKTVIISIFFTIIFLSLSISSGVKLIPKYGIFIGGEVNSIPEEKTSSSHVVSSGIRVRIKGQTKDWLYISTQDADGWVKADTVYKIR